MCVCVEVCVFVKHVKKDKIERLGCGKRSSVGVTALPQSNVPFVLAAAALIHGDCLESVACVARKGCKAVCEVAAQQEPSVEGATKKKRNSSCRQDVVLQKVALQECCRTDSARQSRVFPR